MKKRTVRALVLKGRGPAVAAAVIGSSLFGPIALGQNALGDGRALDRNLSTQTRFNSTRPDAVAEFRFRNAITTGNAPGGLSFRGDVGYTSPREFRGDLASDDLFAFRRDSLYSGLAGMGIRGTDSLQYQFALTTGARPPRNIVGSLSFTRDGVSDRGLSSRLSSSRGQVGIDRLDSGMPGVTGNTIRELSATQRARVEHENGIDTGLLRSPSAYSTTRGLRPSMLGTFGNPGESETASGLSASSLRGLRVTELDRSARPSRAGSSDQRITNAQTELMDRIQQRLEPRINNDLSEEQLAADEERSEAAFESLAERLATLRASLMEQAPVIEDERTELEQQQIDEAAEETEEDEAATPQERRLRFDPETLSLIRSDGEPIRSLVGEGASENEAYQRHMQSGELQLANGRYFDAEERFTRALASVPGDLSAQIGRLHAQLGGGLFVSAGLNMREIFLNHPEAVGARFGNELLPSSSRLGPLTDLLRDRAGLTGDRAIDLRLVRETGLLLAYLGHQLGERGMIEDGLRAARETLSEEEISAESSDLRLLELLEQVWLAEEDGGADGADGADREAAGSGESGG